MKTLYAALAVVSLLATSAVAKTEQTRAPRVGPNNAVIQHNDAVCNFHYAWTDPDSRILDMSRRDCGASRGE
jgi:hypothetical protein